MHIILDTSVVLAFLLSKKTSNINTIISYALEEKITLILCSETLYELKHTIQTDSIKGLPNYNAAKNAKFIAWYQYHTQHYILKDISSKITLRDHTDRIFIQLAEVSKADYLITLDKDLLVLKNIEKTIILTPREFLEMYEIQ